MKPEWEAPAQVHCIQTKRKGGLSTSPYSSLNLGLHIGDLSLSVKQNRQRVKEQLRLPSEPHWLNQVHSARVIHASEYDHNDPPEADGIYTNKPSQVLSIMTADCLPLVLASQKGDEIAAIHCGWRGVTRGIVEQAVAQFKVPSAQIYAWLGPAISQNAFEVGEVVYQETLKLSSKYTQFFKPFAAKWKLDLAGVVAAELKRFGVESISNSEMCTFHDDESFFSYRRDGVTGRMATLVWLSQ